MYDALEAVRLAVGAGLIGAGGYGIANEIHRLVKESRKNRIENVELTDWELNVGYNEEDGIKYPIIVDFRNNPHMLCSGLSRMGKTKMVEYAVKDKQVILINTFKHDFNACRHVIERINRPEEVVKVLQYLVDLKEGENVLPLYVVIDEIFSLALSGEKKIMPLVMRLLALGAHNNVYVIGISQTAEKKIVDCKSLFNTRVCFRLRDDGSYKVVLGFDPDDDITLQPRQFYCLTNELETGWTYDV